MTLALLLSCRGGSVTVPESTTPTDGVPPHSTVTTPAPTGGTGSTTTTTETGTPPAPALVFDGPVPRNLLVLSVDTFRPDHVGRLDPEQRDLTPFLDSILEQALVMPDATACSDWTVASTACVLTGASNVDLADARGMVPILTNDNVVHGPIPPGPSLASWLGAQGYSSLLVSANDWMSGRWDAAQGFDRMDDMPGASATAVWTRAQQRMSEQPLTSPFYLHLHFFEPHKPWTAPAAYLAELSTLPDPGVPLDTGSQQDRALALLPTYPPAQQDAIIANMQARYRGEVRWLDDQLSRIWADLDSQGLLDDTLVLFWTDHGEALWETNYTGHAWFLGPNENDVLAAFWARNLTPGTHAGPVLATDLTPTVLSTFGFPVPAEVTGVPLGTRDPDQVRTAFADAFGGPVQSARKGPWSMQYSWGASGTQVKLFDVVADRATQNDLYDPSAPSAEARELWAAIRAEALIVEPYVTSVDPRGYTLTFPPELETP